MEGLFSSLERDALSHHRLAEQHLEHLQHKHRLELHILRLQHEGQCIKLVALQRPTLIQLDQLMQQSGGNIETACRVGMELRQQRFLNRQLQQGEQQLLQRLHARQQQLAVAAREGDGSHGFGEGHADGLGNFGWASIW